MHLNELHSSVLQMKTCYWNVKYGYIIWNAHCVQCSERFKCTIYRCKLQQCWWNIYGGLGGWVCWCNLIKVLQQQGSCRCKHVTTRQDHHNILHCCLATKTTTLLVTPSKCVQQIAFGVLSIRFNRIINLHSFLLGYDECWSMWCLHRWCVYVWCVCLCLFWQATFNIAIIFGINWNKQATKQKKNINKISTSEKNLIKW